MGGHCIAHKKGLCRAPFSWKHQKQSRQRSDEAMNDKRLKTSHVYAGNPLDRGERERRDEDWIAARAIDPKSRFLPLWELNVLTAKGSQQGLGWLRIDDLNRLGINTPAIFLGMSEGESYFAVDITKDEAAVKELKDSADWRFEDARAATDFLSGPDSGIVAQARAQVNWHNRNGFCAICGHETFVKRGGQVRQCSNCDTEH